MTISPRGGFTLIELIAVLAVSAILVAIAVPALSAARESMNRAKCASNLRQLSTGFLAYAADNNGRLPPAQSASSADAGVSLWPFRIASYVGVPDAEVIRSKLFVCPSKVMDPSKIANPSKYGRWEIVLGYAVNRRMNNQAISQPTEGKLTQRMSTASRRIILAEMEGDGRNNVTVSPAGVLKQNLCINRHTNPKTPSSDESIYPEGRSNYAFLDGHVEYLAFRQTYTGEADSDTNLWGPQAWEETSGIDY